MGSRPRSRRRARIDIGFRTMLRAALVIVFGWLLVQLWPIVLVVVLGLMLAGALSPPITWLERRHVPRATAIAAVFLALFASAGAFAALTVPHLVAQLSRMLEELPKAQADLATRMDQVHFTAPLARSVRAISASDLTTKAAQGLLASSSKVVETAAYAVTVLFLALYLIIDRDRMRGSLFALVPRRFHVRLSRVVLNLETIVGGYVRGQVITSLMMAVFTFTVLTIARAPNAIALAALAGAADVLPYVGGILACGPAVLAAWSHGTPTAIGVLVALVVYQELESRVIVPRVYGRALRLPSAVIIVALLVGGTLLGVLGALIALPLAAGVRMILEELRVELPGEVLDDPELRERDASAERAFARRAAGAPAEEAAAIATEIAEAQIADDAAKGKDPAGVPLTGG